MIIYELNMLPGYLTNIFKALSGETRLKILMLLMEGGTCVCEIQRELGMPQSRVSHQLRELKIAGLIKDRRCGKNICYYIDYESLNGIRRAIVDFLAQNFGRNSALKKSCYKSEGGACPVKELGRVPTQRGE